MGMFQGGAAACGIILPEWDVAGRIEQERIVSTLSDAPVFNLKVVVKETGLKPDTLRVWERRYGIPDPNRTTGGHRLYSERDIAMLNWLQARKEEGLSISRAAALWKRLESEGEDPLETDIAALEAGPDFLAIPLAGDSISQLRREWVKACLAFSEVQSEQTLSQAFAILPAETVVLELMLGGMKAIGEGWYGGEISVQQEHFASAIVTRRLNALLLAAPPPTRPGRILVACPPGEEHTIGPLAFSWILRRRGWDVIYLGANVPLERFHAVLESVDPDIVALSAQRLYTATNSMDMAAAVMDAGIPVVYSGTIFNELEDLDWMPGRFLGEGLIESAGLVEQVLNGKSPSGGRPGAPARGVGDVGLLQHFIQQQKRVEIDLYTQVRELYLQYPSFTMVHDMMIESIQAVLKIGRIEFLQVEIDWAEGYLSHRNAPDGLLDRYLDALYYALLANLDQRGQALAEWIKRRT